MRMLGWLKRREATKSPYERIVDGLIAQGYVKNYEETTQVLGNPQAGQLAIQYFDRLQVKSPLDYTIDDVLRDRPSTLAVIDMSTGKATGLVLKP